MSVRFGACDDCLRGGYATVRRIQLVSPGRSAQTLRLPKPDPGPLRSRKKVKTSPGSRAVPAQKVKTGPGSRAVSTRNLPMAQGRFFSAPPGLSRAVVGIPATTGTLRCISVPHQTGAAPRCNWRATSNRSGRLHAYRGGGGAMFHSLSPALLGGRFSTE